jgi:hypothetical protein
MEEVIAKKKENFDLKDAVKWKRNNGVIR